MIIEEAGKLWSHFYGVVRASGTDHRFRRRDAGCSKPSQKLDGKPSLAGWLKHRKNAVEGAKSAEGVASLCPDDALWTESHEKELSFQKECTSKKSRSSFLFGDCLTRISFK